MQDHIPDALITAFERQYDSSWNDPQLRNERLAMRYGWAAAMEANQCLHQIQEPAPATAMDALREAEAALEVAMARILKADPGHSICVTSEAKALVAVRAALAATAPVDALATGGQAQELADTVQTVIDALQDKIDARGPISKGNLQYYVNLLREAFDAAPQAQADARDAEQERWMGIGKAIERACVDLPAGAEINIHLEKDAGTVTLSDCDGDEQENFPTDEGLAGVVNAAIDAAIAAAKGE